MENVELIEIIMKFAESGWDVNLIHYIREHWNYC